MKKKDIKAFQGLEAVIDENYKLLCDRIGKLELSHKRMFGLLQRVLVWNDDIVESEEDFECIYHCWNVLIARIRCEVERKVL